MFIKIVSGSIFAQQKSSATKEKWITIAPSVDGGRRDSSMPFIGALISPVR